MKLNQLLIWLPTLIRGQTNNTKCISIYGLETPLRNFVCSWVRPVEYYVKELKRLHFNTLRIPFSYEYVQQKDWKNLDHLFDLSDAYNMSVLLDMHRIWSSHQGPGPEEGITLNDFIEKGWFPILDRYINRTSLVGHNVFNEYTGNDVQYMTDYSARVTLAIEYRYPKRLVHYITGTVWSSSLHSVSLDFLNFTSKELLYSVHRYAWHGTNQTDWDRHFGDHLDHMIVGEFGWKDVDTNWAKQFIEYLKRKRVRNACFWTVAHSSDTDGMWFDDCLNVNWNKYKILDELWH